MMRRLFLSKLLPPALEGALSRPRLMVGPRPRILLAQAPAGCGKSLFLAQWAAEQGLPCAYYQLDEQDRDPAAFAAYITTGFQRIWPDWQPSADSLADPLAIAAELVNEAVRRPPALLVLDRLDGLDGAPFLADFLSLWSRYAPPSLTLAIGTRAPLPVDLGALQRNLRLVTASDLAFTDAEARALFGEGGWEEPFHATGGCPGALALWQQTGAGWRTALAEYAVAELPRHVAPEVGRSLVDEWMAGRLGLGAFAYQVSQGLPGAERLWSEVEAIRSLLLLGEVGAVRERLTRLWEQGPGRSDRALAGAVALLWGELYYSLGEYARALEWFRQSFEADPVLETVGTHSLVAILRDLGQLEEAESLGRRCVEARKQRADLQALAYAHAQYGNILTELGRLDEAEEHYLEAERLGLRLSGEAFYGILALGYRSVLQVLRGNPAGYLRLAKEAHGLAQRRSPWLEAICSFILAPALLAWGEGAAGMDLLNKALAFLTAMDSKWELHMVHTILATAFWHQERHDEARSHMDRALALAAREGYVQYLSGPRSAMPLLLDALVRGVEVPFIQEVLVRKGERALPDLLAMTGQTDPRARRAALYPLTVIGGERAAAAIRHLLYDPDEAVRESALVALKSLGQVAAAAPKAVAVAAPQAVQPRLTVNLLGAVEVVADGEPVQSWRTVKARDLLAFLVLAGERPVTRDQIIEALWPESDLESGQSLLHTTLYQLRRAIKPAGEGAIAFAGGAYRLNREGLFTDLDRFHRLAEAGGEDGLREAAALYRGDLMESADYPWADAARVRARTAYLQVLRNLAETARQTERPDQAIGWLQLLLQADPLAEDGHVALMECYAAAGNRNAALQQYRTLVRLLDVELGLEPGDRAKALYLKLLG